VLYSGCCLSLNISKMILATPGADSKREGRSKGREKSAKKVGVKRKVPFRVRLNYLWRLFLPFLTFPSSPRLSAWGSLRMRMIFLARLSPEHLRGSPRMKWHMNNLQGERFKRGSIWPYVPLLVTLTHCFSAALYNGSSDGHVYSKPSFPTL